MGIIRNFFDGFGKKKSKADRMSTPIESKKKYKKKEVKEPEKQKHLSTSDQMQKRKGKLNRKKNKITRLTRKGNKVKLWKIANKNSANKRRKKLGLNFNPDSPEREMRDKIRDARRKALKK